MGMMESSSKRKGVWDEKNDGLHHESSLEGYEHVTLRHYGGDIFEFTNQEIFVLL